MCGIFGYLGNQNIDYKSATNIIAHRGPDSNGFYLYKGEENEVVFGFRRLAIIDLDSRSNQPFKDETEAFVLVFNGEIYNYKELRIELEKEGISFSTSSDTEVLLSAYKKWGKQAFERFNGMWSLAILDKERKEVVCSRDRFGIKPFYYHSSKDFGFAFGSEIKQLLSLGLGKEVNEGLIKDYISKSLVDTSQETFFKGIFSLKPGSILTVHIDNPSEYNLDTFWTLESKGQYENLNYEEACKTFRELFEDSIKLRFRSDVPVGSCLSGGLDSSSIVAVAANQSSETFNTFTSRFDEKEIDETAYVKLMLEKYSSLSGHFCQLTERDFVEEFEKVLHHQDEPFTTMSMLAQWEVMKLAKQNDVIVLMDGQGGDESLAGYRKFYAFYIKELVQKGKLLKALKEFSFLVRNKSFNFFDLKGIKRYLGRTPSDDVFSERGKALSFKQDFGFSSAKTLQSRSKLDIEKFSFPPLLRYEDRNSMAHSIETRIPFMDYRLVEFLYSIPSSFKIRSGFTKAILRDSLSDILPKAIKNRISKLGFETPQEIWMNGPLNEYFDVYFQNMDNPYFDTKSIIEGFRKDKRENNLYFRVFCFDQWYKKHFNGID